VVDIHGELVEGRWLNMAFFHHSTIVRQARDLIAMVKTKHGEKVVGREKISAIFLAYFW